MPPLSVDLAAPVERVREMAEGVLGARPDPDDPDTMIIDVRFPTGQPTPVRLRVERLRRAEEQPQPGRQVQAVLVSAVASVH